MMGGMRAYRVLALVVAVVVLAGCGRSRVVREYPHRGGHGATTRLPPVRIASSMATISDSPPSSEKRFWPTYLVCR